MFQIMLLVAALGQADPPRIEQPDPPRLAARVAELEGRVQRLETALGIASYPAVKEVTITPIGSTGPVVIGTQPEYRFPIRVQSAPTTYSYSSSSTATCAGPNCGQATQAKSTGWYLGKNLGR